MSTARLRYSGIVIFSSRLLGIVTGTIFTMIVTRRLMVEEFGAWQYVSVFFSYFTIPSSFTGFWITRQVSRGERLATTGLLLNLLFSIPAILLFIVLSIPASEAAGITTVFFLVISPQVFLMYLLPLLEAVATSVEPHLVGYGSIVFEFAKILLGVALVLNMRLSLMGALLSVEMAYVLQVIFLFIVLRKQFKRVFSRETARKWLVLIWIPLLSSLSTQIQQLDSIITTLITRSTVPIAMLKAAQVFSMILSYTGYAASALYPRLLAGGGKSDVETSIRLVSLFAIPIMFGSIVLAEPLLAVLRKDYVEAAMVLRISVIMTAVITIVNLADPIILASENVDVSGNIINLRSYLRSKLALLPILGLLYDAAYLFVLFFVVNYLSSINAKFIIIAATIVLTAFIIIIPQLVYKWRLAKRLIPFKFPVRSIVIYAIAAVVMSIVIESLNPSGAVSTEIGRVISELIPKIAVGGIVYFLMTAALDNEPRIIVKGFLREICHHILRTEA